MRPIWKGHISFGLVNVPVTLYSAEQRADLSLHMIDSRNHARIRYERVNAETGEEVPWDQIVRGYEYDNGSYVVLDDEELKHATPEATQTVEIESFADLGEIDLVYFDKPYYLEPGKKGDKGYALLREVLKESGKAGIARVVIRTRQYLAALVAREDVLVLNLLRWKQELRGTDELDLPGSDLDKLKVTKQELKMARTLVDSMTQPWQPDEFHDEYREVLMKWIEERIEAGDVERLPDSEKEEEDLPPTINMMEALKKSVEASSRGGKSKSSSRKSTKKKSAGSAKKSAKAKKKTTRKKAG